MRSYLLSSLPLILILFVCTAFPLNGFAQTASATGRVSRPRLARAAGSSAVTKLTVSRGISTSLSVEKRVFALINAKRAALGAPALSWCPKCADVARGHSKEMALYDYFSHTDVDGNLVDARADNAGLTDWSAIGENIAYIRGFQDPAEYAVERWLLSPSHRENLLDPRWRETGVGLAVTSDGTYFFTQIFVVE